MYSWQKINLEQDPWWLEYRLNIDNMQGRVWRSSSGLWRQPTPQSAHVPWTRPAVS